MKKILSIAVLTSLMACGSSEEEQAAAEAEAAEAVAALQGALENAAAEAEQAAEAAPAAAEAAPTPAAAGGDSNYGTITLAPGFMPDPSTATGTSGGSTAAGTLDPSCAGNVSTTPDHLFVASGAFANLRIMAKSAADTTLVVQRPDGTYLCNDDGDTDFNPIVAGAFPAGTYKIWVGSYDAEANGSYTLGITELDSVTPASLP